MPRISIIICTRSRADSLRETLASIGQCEVPSDLSAELLVVDNGSTDHTREVVKQAVLANMRVRHVFEPRAGKGYAYNTGMAEARGAILLFTDDDVRVPTDWIESMCRPIADGQADAVQGPIKLAAHLDQPWLTEMGRTMLAVVAPRPEAPPTDLVGANMAFSAKVREKVPEFDVELGPGASGLADDTFFGTLLSQNGYRIAWGSATVEHHCDTSRLSWPYALEWAGKCGTSLSLMDRKLGRPRVAFSSARARLIWLKGHLRCLLQRPGGRLPPDWLMHYAIQVARYSSGRLKLVVRSES